MCALLTENLSAPRCSAQELWRDDQTLTSGPKVLGCVAGTDRPRMLHALEWYIYRRTIFDLQSLS